MSCNAMFFHTIWRDVILSDVMWCDVMLHNLYTLPQGDTTRTTSYTMIYTPIYDQVCVHLTKLLDLLPFAPASARLHG